MVLYTEDAMERKEVIQRGIEKIHNWGHWSGLRELGRGAFHVSVGFTGWLLIHPYQVDNAVIWLLFFLVAFGMWILDEIRLAVIKADEKNWFIRLLKWINNKMVRRWFTRDVEDGTRTTILKSVVGLGIAWAIAPRWIAVMAGLLFSLVDAFSKLGKYWPIKRFVAGPAKGKSVGGCLFGFFAGVIGAVWVVSFHIFSVPLFTVPLFQAIAVYALGVAVAPLAELYTGKQDNIFIPVGSALLMVVANYFFSFLG